MDGCGRADDDDDAAAFVVVNVNGKKERKSFAASAFALWETTMR